MRYRRADWGQVVAAMGKAIIRLKDIADKTGFSTNTVSLALRESPRIPLQTRELIRRAADELNYLPNQIAKSLVSRETKTIGLVLTDITNRRLPTPRRPSKSRWPNAATARCSRPRTTLFPKKFGRSRWCAPAKSTAS
jgi:hypothetical protein